MMVTPAARQMNKRTNYTDETPTAKKFRVMTIPQQLTLPAHQPLPPQHPLPIIEEPVDDLVPYVPTNRRKKWAPYPPTQAAIQAAKTRKSLPQPLPLASQPSTSVVPHQHPTAAPARISKKRRATDSNLPVAKQARNWAQVHPLFARNSVIPQRAFHIDLPPNRNLALTRYTQRDGR
jgi:hypothetical protein